MSFLILLQSISYNKVVFTKQIYFSSTYLKPWAHISDNITGVAGDRRKEEDYVITLDYLDYFYTIH